MLNNTSEFGVDDAEISTISSVSRRKLFAHDLKANRRRYDAAQWHSDIQFEPVPADYTSLRLVELPRDENGTPTGGDTLWASGYELYDRFSAPYQKFLEGLTATFSGEGFTRAAAANPDKVKIHTGPRGNPANSGTDLAAVHPVVRTNPVTGWKSIFALGPFPKKINELHADESEELLKKLLSVIPLSHELQARLKWKNENDLAIWDNRSVFHTATFDYEGLGERTGNRAVGIGERYVLSFIFSTRVSKFQMLTSTRPFFDPNSKSRTEALAEEAGLKTDLPSLKAEDEPKQQVLTGSA